MNYLRKVFGLGSVGPGGSRTFGLWSKYFAGISDSRGLGINRNENNYENKNKNGRIIITIIFRLFFCCFFSCSIIRFFLAILIW
jgi:hypothetical protein